MGQPCGYQLLARARPGLRGGRHEKPRQGRRDLRLKQALGYRYQQRVHIGYRPPKLNCLLIGFHGIA